MSNNNPNIDPANNGSLVGTISFAYQQLLAKTDGMLPAKVITYDRENNRVKVQILITMVTTDGSQVPRPTVASIPVLIIGGGGFSLSFPLKAGDLGWIMANDRDVSLFLQTYAQAQPNTRRVKNFSDGMFIPDVMRTYNWNAGTDGYVTLQSENGKASVSIGINPLTTATEVNIKADRVNVEFNNPITGILAVYGNINATGTITPSLPIPPYIP